MLSALDARRCGKPVLFLVHRLDILKQSIDAYKFAWPDIKVGILTGETRESERDCDVLFASKDTLRQPYELSKFSPDWFNYIVVDEVHHQSHQKDYFTMKAHLKSGNLNQERGAISFALDA